jgi:hypothetical protein
MGLKITTELCTDAGLSSEVYVNIKSISISKNGTVSGLLNNYLNREARDLNEHDTISCRRLRSDFLIPIGKETPYFDELISQSIYSFVYSKLKEQLAYSDIVAEDDL